MKVQSSKWRVLSALIGIAVVAAIVAGCGGGGSSSSGGSTGGSGSGTTAETSAGEGSEVDLAALEKIVAEHAKPGPIGPTVPIGKPIPKDVYVIFINAGAPANISQEESFDEAAQVLGWKVENLTTEPTPPAIQSTFEEVIRREPDAVATTGLAIEQFPEQAKKLNELEIPIISNTGTDPSTFNPKEGITLQNQEPDEVAEAAALLADKAIVDAGGEGEFGAVNLTGYPSVAINVEGFEHEIESKCPKCTVKHLEVNPSSLGKDAPTIITNFLRANPGITGIYFGYDGIAVGLNSALKGAGVEPPDTYAWAPDEVGVQELQSGEQTAAIPLGYPEGSWQFVDAIARLETGGNVEDSKPVGPYVIWSKELNNVPEETKNPPVNPNYQEEFKKLWGVK
jgi:ABC-type sugar transport system substrate-binding protein